MLVGVNLLREGLDLPEVSLVAILDADKEGFLRGETSLIQTIGRAARNVDGTVLMYADKQTRAMRAAIDETDRRREIQLAYNERNGITAATIVKGISDIAEFLQAESKVPRGRKRRARARPRRRCRGTSSSGWWWSSRRRCSRRLTSCASSTPPSSATSCASCGATFRRSAPRKARSATAARQRWSPPPAVRRVTSPRIPLVELDRQSIERKDFPIGRRGYDATAVDAHLRAVAVGVEELQRTAVNAGHDVSFASSAGSQVQNILEAAETAAAEIERQTAEAARQVREAADRDAERTREEAIETARAHVSAVAQVAATLLERVGRDGLRGARARREPALGRGAARRRPARGRGATWRSSTTPPRAISTRPGSPTRRRRHRGRPPRSRIPPRRLMRWRANRASSTPSSPGRWLPRRRPRQPVQQPAAPAPAPPVAPAAPAPAAAGASEDLDGARLVALNMALNGESRADTDRYLAEHFQVADRLKLIDEVYAAIEG